MAAAPLSTHRHIASFVPETAVDAPAPPRSRIIFDEKSEEGQHTICTQLAKVSQAEGYQNIVPEIADEIKGKVSIRRYLNALGHKGPPADEFSPQEQVWLDSLLSRYNVSATAPVATRLSRTATHGAEVIQSRARAPMRRRATLTVEELGQHDRVAAEALQPVPPWSRGQVQRDPPDTRRKVTWETARATLMVGIALVAGLGWRLLGPATYPTFLPGVQPLTVGAVLLFAAVGIVILAGVRETEPREA